jgi:hypothetical protein
MNVQTFAVKGFGVFRVEVFRFRVPSISYWLWVSVIDFRVQVVGFGVLGFRV